jgi:hypothetical protein
MSTESDVEALRHAIGELAGAVKDLADAVRQGPFSDSATMRVAVDVSRTASTIAGRFAAQGTIAGQPGDPASVGAVPVPEEVASLARAGKTLEAVTRYRAATGATLDEARAVISDIT